MLVDPCHCIQKDQYFIVSDWGDGCIKVFNTEGDFLYKFGNEGDGNVLDPRGLSVDKAGHLIVCDSENDKVQILELTGKFIANFELIGPVSTASLTDGRIVVSVFCDDCVKIIG